MTYPNSQKEGSLQLVSEPSPTLSLIDNHISKSFLQNHRQIIDEKAKYRSIGSPRVVSTHIVTEYISDLAVIPIAGPRSHDMSWFLGSLMGFPSRFLGVKDMTRKV